MDAFGAVPLSAAANTLRPTPLIGIGLSSASRRLADVSLLATVDAGTFPFGATYPLRARTVSPGRLTRTCTLRKRPSRRVSLE